jgi:hypothetical protein
MQRTKLLDRRVQRLLDTRVVGDVTRMKRGVTSDLAGRLGTGGAGEIEDGDLGSALAQLLSGGARHARGASDDDCFLPVDLHFSPLRLGQVRTAN